MDKIPMLTLAFGLPFLPLSMAALIEFVLGSFPPCPSVVDLFAGILQTLECFIPVPLEACHPYAR